VGGDDTLPGYTMNDLKIDMEIYLRMEQQGKRKDVFSTMYDYFDSIENQELPVVRGPIETCELTYNIPSRSSDGMYRARYELERLLLTAEKMDVMRRMAGAGSETEELNRLWRALIAISGHGREALLEQDFLAQGNIAACAVADAAMLVNRAAQKIADTIEKHGDAQYAVFNTHPWDVEGYVRLHVTSAYNVKPFVIRDAYGKEIPFQVESMYWGDKPMENCLCNEMEILARVEAPSFGYQSLEVVFDEKANWPQKPDIKNIKSAEGMVGNRKIYMRYENNSLKSVEDSGGRVLFGENDLFARLRFFETEPVNDWYSNVEPLSEYAFTADSAVMEKAGALSQRLSLKGKIKGMPAKLAYTFFDGEDDMQIDIEFESDGSEGFYTLAFSCDEQPEIKAGIPFGTEKRDVAEEAYAGEISKPGEEYLALERAMQGSILRGILHRF
jgi:hypothetical protein